MKIRQWLFGAAFGSAFRSLDERVTALETDERKKRKQRARAIRRARLQHKWLNNLKDQPLTEEERRRWQAGDE
jgi:hypothetical protein